MKEKRRKKKDHQRLQHLMFKMEISNWKQKKENSSFVLFVIVTFIEQQ